MEWFLDIFPILAGTVAVVTPLLGAIAIASAVHAVMQNRTPQGAAAWVVSLISLPIVALPLYWVFGRDRFRGYVAARRAGDHRFRSVIRELLEHGRQFAVSPGGVRAELAAMGKLVEMPFTRGNDVRLLIGGEAAFRAILHAIDEAKDYILIEFFIVHDDELGRDLEARLLAAAARKVRVCFIYDEIGSRKLSRRYIRSLREAGVDIRPFNTTRGWRNRFQLNLRNHRKIVVVDGRLAFVGGLNVGDEYVGRIKRFGAWRDTHLELEGPSVQCVQLAFLEDWHWATGDTPQLDWKPVESGKADRRVLTLATGPADELHACGLFFVQTINAARRRLWIASPYFVPDESVMTALTLAALRGVDVRILLPEKADHLLVYLSGFSFIEDVDQFNVRFYRYRDGFMHQKVMLVDDDLAVVGTANLDNRSFRLNFELSILVNDRDFANQVRAMLEEDFAVSTLAEVDEFQRRPLWFRAAVRFARLLAPLQ